ncbi:outer membrane beta-barrel protein, partial [Prevotella sp.]
LMSNASINYSFCKNKCRLALWVDDIFNKDIYYDSEYSAYQRVENSANYLHHYMNLTFTYRFDAKSKK